MIESLVTERATTSTRLNPPKTLETDWTQRSKSDDLYHIPNPNVEPTGTEKARPPKKHLAPQSGGQAKRLGYTGGQLEKMAQDRDAWTAFVGGLCSTRGANSLKMMIMPQ